MGNVRTASGKEKKWPKRRTEKIKGKEQHQLLGNEGTHGQLEKRIKGVSIARRVGKQLNCVRN